MAIDHNIKGLRVNYSILFLTGLFMLVGSILTYLLIIKNIYGNYKIAEILPTKDNLTMVGGNRDKKAAILYSRYTENMLTEGNTWVSDNVDSWENYLKQIKFGYDVIDDRQIETGNIGKYGLLILPGAKSLSDRQLVQIKKYLENGGSVYATSGTASFSDEGKWRGWEFFSEVFGLQFTKELEPEEYLSKIHTLRGNLPITAGIPTGYTLNIATWDRPIYAEILDPRTTQVSFWYDFRNEAGLVMEEINKSAGMAFGTYGKGRFVWMGFELNSVIGREESQKDPNYWNNFAKLFENCVNWLTYMPTAFVRDWPSDYEAASVMVVDVEDQPQNVNYINSLIKDKNYRITYFVSPEVANSNKSLIANLKKHGDVAAVADIGYLASLNDTINQLFSKKQQAMSINYSKKRLEKIAGAKTIAAMPKYGFFNENTKLAFVKYGIDCILTDSLTDRTVPRLEIWDKKSLITIGKTARDDYHVVKKYGLVEPEFQKYTYQEDVDRILFEGGLYIFKLHTQYQLRPEYVTVVNDVVDYMKKKKIWLTSLSEVKKWWKTRGDLEFRYEIRSKRRLALEVYNPHDNVKNDFVVQIYVNKPIKELQISSDIINTVIPKYYYDKQSQIVNLFVKNLKPGETRSLVIDFDNVSLL